VDGGEVGQKGDLQDFGAVSGLDEGTRDTSDPIVGLFFFLEHC
jgi:hypothetical protein